MAEGAPLLREYAGDRIEGSNPFLSASRLLRASFVHTPLLVAGFCGCITGNWYRLRGSAISEI